MPQVLLPQPKTICNSGRFAPVRHGWTTFVPNNGAFFNAAPEMRASAVRKHHSFFILKSKTNLRPQRWQKQSAG